MLSFVEQLGVAVLSLRFFTNRTLEFFGFGELFAQNPTFSDLFLVQIGLVRVNCHGFQMRQNSVKFYFFFL